MYLPLVSLVITSYSLSVTKSICSRLFFLQLLIARYCSRCIGPLISPQMLCAIKKRTKHEMGHLQTHSLVILLLLTTFSLKKANGDFLPPVLSFLLQKEQRTGPVQLTKSFTFQLTAKTICYKTTDCHIYTSTDKHVYIARVWQYPKHSHCSLEHKSVHD